ncbi:hypothetical protein [Hymenobacter crusticola]|uniref:Uncharacterized protein n=1 Tax=Hymenobacter crusticola TaxID=1770526 RepID=A0A243W7J2_9BACT|nr:hypothetical protein [Hymenobacter crusticola]OUJ71003.1 hypothetical protein BXP70_22805 [Hymenobacter crusticola]
MEEEKAQCLIYWALNAKQKLASPKISMWSTDGIDKAVPYLRFRFAGVPLASPLYNQLAACIQAYQGLTQWACLYDPDRSRNYFLLPQVFAPHLFTHGVYKEQLLSVMAEQVYQEAIQVAMRDAPNLSRHIEQNWEVE